MRRLAVLTLAALLAGCAAGPDYRKPQLEMPSAWAAEAPWRESRPDDAARKGPWWERFGDPQLNLLQEQALRLSPTLALANARLAQARAALSATSASVMPQIGVSTRGTRQKISANRPLSNYNSANFSTVQNDLVLAMSVNYEVDLAGRV